MQHLTGLFTALVTPFNKHGYIDLDGFRENIQFQLANQVDGVIVLGTTGEAPTLSDEEKTALIKCARAETKGKIPLIVGTGSYATKTTLESTKKAKDLGADAALIVSPYYNKPTQEGLYLHFKEIAENVSLPIILYNHLGRCGIGLEMATLLKLAKLPSIIGIKEVTTNIEQLNSLIETMQREHPDFKIFSGDDGTAFTFLANGGHGLISVASNLIPLKMKALIDACLVSDFLQGRNMHLELLPLFRALNLETNPIPIKAAMNIAEIPSGPCRLPLCAMQAKHKDTLKRLLEEMNLIRHLATLYG